MSWVTPWRTDVPAFFRALRNANGGASGTIVGIRFEDGEETKIKLDMIDHETGEDPVKGRWEALRPMGHTLDPDPENEPGVSGIEAWFMNFAVDAPDDGTVVARGSYYNQEKMDYLVTDEKTVEAVREGEDKEKFHG